MQYVFAFITKRYIASRLVFAVMAVNLTYPISVIIAGDAEREFQNVYFFLTS